MVNPLYPIRAARFSSKGKWQRMSNGEKIQLSGPLPSSIRLLTWNVDFMEAKRKERLIAALGHIQKDIFRCKGGEAPEPCCILLQEVHVRAFEVVLENEWVRKHFAITPVTPDKWPDQSTYGNITLVSRSIPLSQAWSLVFEASSMSRNALLVDLKLGVPPSDAAGPRGVVTVRVGNTHLESMPEGARLRPMQMSLIAKLLREKELDCGIVGGDMNAIGPSDARIVGNVGLVDAWGGEDSDEEGHTWGYQPSGEYQPGRLDKIAFTPGRRFDIEEPQMIGVGVTTVDGIWASDHYGLLTTVRVLSK